MQDFYLIINWVVACALLGLGSVALLKNYYLTLNRVFALFTITIGIWIIAAYISNDPHNSSHVSVIGNYFVFLFSYISGYLLLWFAIALAEDTRAATRLHKLMVPVLLIGATTPTPLVVAGAKRQGSVYAVEFGPLVLLYFVALLIILVAAMAVLHKNIKLTKGDQRAHLVILYRSMGIALPILLLTEFILPAVTGWFGLTNVGILSMAIPVAALYYGVVKLKLFNLRLAIIRSLAYILAVVIIGTTYGVISYYLTTFTKITHDQVLQVVLDTLLIVIAINIYPLLIKTFRRLTNKLFYRDAYEAQELFSQLNRLLVSTLNLDHLLNQVSLILVENIKAQFCLFDLRATEHSRQRIISDQKKPLRMEDIAELQDMLVGIKHNIIAVDDLTHTDDDLRRYLETTNIAVVIRLIPKSNRQATELGYIFLGPKNSGNPYSGQDLRVLDTIANELVVSIQNALHYEEIQNFNLTLQQKVDDATRALRRANDKLKALDETKDDFISMASHQLRTPLTSVKGYISMVLEGDAGKITHMQREMLGQAFFSSQRMVYLIADLLNISRLKTGKFIIEPARVNLANVVEQELGQLEETAQSRSLALTYDKPDKFPDLMLDETKTRQVIMNFVDNAIYYTPSGGHVTVHLVNKPQTVELRVEDDGIGVPHSEQQHLFTKFYRAANARKARPDGTGLGLFMAKKVIIAQGGALIFESREGQGSTFGFVFSKSKLAKPQDTEKRL